MRSVGTRLLPISSADPHPHEERRERAMAIAAAATAANAEAPYRCTMTTTAFGGT